MPDRRRATPTFAARLRRLRTQAGLTQRDLAAKTGIAQPHIARMESGRRESPQLATLRRLAKALGVGLDAFG